MAAQTIRPLCSLAACHIILNFQLSVGKPAEAREARPESDWSYVISRSRLIPVGEPAPDFTCALSDGAQLSLSSLHGLERVVLVFYPGDNTPLCTSQLCAFRDDWEQFGAHKTRVYGVNPAGQARHAHFAEQHRFPFPLLVDTGGQVAGAYGCRMLFGIVRRAVYMIDRQGRVAFAEQGNPAPALILRALEDLKD